MERSWNFKNESEYKKYLDKAPDDTWLQKRDLGGGKTHVFLPVFIIEACADVVFDDWHVVDEKYFQMSGGVGCTVKINATPSHPDSEVISFTGTAAVMFKTSKNNAEFDIPNARERGIAKAFSTLGNIFGRNLNRTYKNDGGQKRLLPKGYTMRKYND